MAARDVVKNQLRSIGHRYSVFGRAEMKELQNILHPDENIVQCAYGYYHGGSGLLVATNKRLLLVDKRPFYLNLEIIPFDQIKFVEFSAKLLQGTLYLESGIKRLLFRSVSDARLRKICEHAKEKIKDIEKPLIDLIPSAQVSRKPYLNPAWRPHHLTKMNRPRISKYYSDPTRPVTS
jgi:hypothetical protein